MDFRTLRAFVEVVRQGGFSQAAKTVFATQSTVSKAVKQLEDEIGAPLLDRIGHRTQLTDLGELVYLRAVRLLADRNDLLAELEELRGLKRGVCHRSQAAASSPPCWRASAATIPVSRCV
jgi:DNA-binding transcriptional LysR family regulator